MIYTVTLNPSIDCYMTADPFEVGRTNRATDEHVFYGGKGINVSLVLKEFGIDSTALGFIAGSNGLAIRDGLKDKINTDFDVLSEGNSRINLKLFSSGKETEINGIGPHVGEDALRTFLRRFESLSDDDIVIMSGSVPKDLPETLYGDMAKRITSCGSSFVCDSTGELLLNTLQYGPMIIKPNIDELGALYGRIIDPDDLDTIYALSKDLQSKGAKEVIVSLGDKGAVLLEENGSLTLKSAYKGEFVSSVCAGDSLLAGFIAGKKKGLSSVSSLEMGVAAGSACAFSYGLPTSESIIALLGRPI
ncbi:MAG: 1-phosphofructokinase family hexose kinase [Clostridia bacterium]|nr:1-phosphofructokinase family hexose kinase [Clostridia bacterium]